MTSHLQQNPGGPSLVAAQRPPEMFQHASGFVADRSQFLNVQGGMHIHPSPPSAGAATSTEPPPCHVSDNEVYCTELWHCGRGYPLHDSEPQTNLPQEYRLNGVSIGDVGWVTPEGNFDYMFNVFHQANHPVNGNRVPDDFSPLGRYDPLDVFHRRFEPGDHVLSPSVQAWNQEVAGNYPGGEYLFHCKNVKGALLALPHGSHLEKLRDVEPMRVYAANNAESWYRYTNEIRGRRLINGGLYLITGCEKARSGGIATYQNVAPESDFHLAFHPSPDSDGGRYRFSRGTPARTRTFTSDALGTDQPLNNTVFLHGFTISLGEGLWGRLFGNVGVSEITDTPFGKNPTKFVPFSSPGTGSFFSFSMNFLGRSAGAAGKRWENVTIADLAPTPKIIHPSQKIHEIIRHENPCAEVIITHDDDWQDLLRSDDARLGDLMYNTTEFRKRLFRCLRVVDAEGTIYLVPYLSSQSPISGTSISQNPSNDSSIPSALEAVQRARDSPASKPGRSPTSQRSMSLALSSSHSPRPMEHRPLPATPSPSTTPPPLYENYQYAVPFVPPVAPSSAPHGDDTLVSSTAPACVNRLLRYTHVEYPLLTHDLTFHPSTMSTSGSDISSTTLAESATYPPTRALSIVSPHLPWVIPVSAPQNQTYISVADVLAALHTGLRKPITAAEYAALQSEKVQRRVAEAFKRRCMCLKNHRGYEGEQAGGVRRVDFLVGWTHFRGLEATGKDGVWRLHVGWGDMHTRTSTNKVHGPSDYTANGAADGFQPGQPADDSISVA